MNVHPIMVIYGPDSRFALERNIGKSGGKPGVIEDFVKWLKSTNSPSDPCHSQSDCTFAPDIYHDTSNFVFFVW